MKVAIIGTVGIPAKYGGFETLADKLTKELREDFNFTVYCSSKSYRSKLKSYNGAKLEYISLNANGLQSIFYDIFSIILSIRRSDILLILGVSGALIIPFIKIFSSKKIIIHIDGLEWKRNKWNRLAKWYLRWSEKIAIKSADYIIADNYAIQEYVSNTYKKKSELIEYGADHIINQKSVIPLTNAYSFSVCRIEPENNIHIILKAFSLMPELNLKFVGNWDANLYSKRLKQEFLSFSNIELINPIYEQDKLDKLRSNCWLYIHGHSAGGTNPSLVEAMGLSLPIIAFDVNYNRYSTNERAVYFKNTDELVEILTNINVLNVELIAENMLKLAKEKYTWSKVANKYMKLFKR